MSDEPAPPSPTRKPRWWRRIFVALGLTLLVALGIAAVPVLSTARQWADEGVAMVDAHAHHDVSHPGWSFPARVQTEPVPLTEPARKLVVEAKARGYTEDCKATGPGEFCEKTGKVVPRSGDTLEPIQLGWLIGPDGELRVHLPLEDAPKLLLDAIVSAEDRDFRDHHGVNFKAMLRAVYANAQEGTYSQGGSTLTMQVVRNLNQRKEKTVERKLREMVLALAVDDHLGKDGVLQMYLDAPYLGQWGSLSICGFESAATYYFGKHAHDLDLAEAATLAAILPAPGKFSPDRHPAEAKERRDRVLDAMHEVFAYDVTAAKAEPVKTVPPEPLVERYPAYLSATRAWLEQHVAADILYGSGLTITVGMDVYAQDTTDQLFSQKIPMFDRMIGKKRPEGMESAGVLMDVATGRIRAVWGGDDVTAISFNRATQARRQPGSSFKPLVYAMAFEQKNPDGTRKYTAATAEPNAPRAFDTPEGVWRPRNVMGEYSSTACLAQALTWSQNIATASLLEDLGGPKPLVEFATKLGFDTTKFPVEMGLALGQGEVTPLEMAQFASTVAEGGELVLGSPVLQAVDAGGTVRVDAPRPGSRVLSPEGAALTRELMRSVIDAGTGGAARGAGGEGGYQGPAMGKTGTTDKERDLWFVGATPRYAAALWLGYDVPAPLGVAASDLAAPLWGWWMNRLTRNDGPLPEFPDEPKIIHRTVCKVTGKVPNGSCPLINAPFLEGTAPKQGCPALHAAPPPEESDEGGGEEEAAPADPGAPPAKKPGHESIWQKLAREKAEAAGQAPAPPAPAPKKP